MSSDPALGLLKSPIGLELFHLLEWRHESPADLTDGELLARAHEACASNQPYRGDYAEHLRFLRMQAGRFEAAAESIAGRLAGWWQPLDRGSQVWSHSRLEAPDPSKLALDLTPVHPESPKPAHAMWTCSLLFDVVTPWLAWGERGQGERIGSWKLGVPETSRIAEIHSPADWWELAHAYPAEQPGFRYALMPDPSHPGAFTSDRSSAHARVDPNWSLVARDFDGVHVSLGGVLTAQDVPFVWAGVTTELRGWDVESTVWLRWVFDSVERLDSFG